MTNTYFSITEYDYSGQTSFTTPSYLQADNISVTVNGVTKTRGTAYTLSGTQVAFTAGNIPNTGDKIRIKRASSQSTRQVDYTDGSMLKAQTLDDDANQLFYMAQEALDIGQGLELSLDAHPTTVSSFTNDAGYLTASSIIDGGTTF